MAALLSFIIRKLLVGLWLLTLGLAALAQPQPGAGAAAVRPVVYVAPIEGMIDLGQAPYVQRVLNEAKAAGAAAVVLEINTFGGRVDAAVQIRDALLNSPVRTIAFVNKRAISAGALISLATHTIVMGTGGTLGAATPVLAGAGGGMTLPAEEKTVSYVRKEFRATAEARQRPPLLAEAMVDADIAIPGVIDKGKLLTLTTEEALRLKMADFRADTLEQALQATGLAGAEVRRVAPNWAENVVRAITQPVLASLLVTLALAGIIIELRTPGLGLAGVVGAVSLGLVLWGHWIAQLAGLEEMLLVVAGVVLLVVEIFIIPGFGVAGFLGITALLVGLVLSLTGAGNTTELLVQVAGRLVFSLLLAIAVSLLLLRFITHTRAGRRLTLQTGLAADAGWTSPPPDDAQWLHRTGVAASMLRPAGFADIDGARVDVVSDGEFIDAGAPVQVVRVDGNRIVVRRIHNHQPEGKTT
ncbi:MAG TPA: NfeD family protein [Ramlibacter sp.]|nr:NfeD family protein [Ramlibacter sp.]